MKIHKNNFFDKLLDLNPFRKKFDEMTESELKGYLVRQYQNIGRSLPRYIQEDNKTKSIEKKGPSQNDPDEVNRSMVVVNRRTINVVVRYGKALEKWSKIGLFFPESKLPFDRQTIKNELIHSIRALKDSDPQMVKYLEGSYIFLANFIPDSDAEICLKQEALMKQASKLDRNDPKSKDQFFILAQQIENLSERTSEIRNRVATLSLEYGGDLKFSTSAC